MPYDLYGEDAEAGGWLAAVRAALRERAMPANHPNPDAPQMSREFQGPLFKDWLLQSLIYGPMALGSRSGAWRGRDAVLENQGQLGITGGQPGFMPPDRFSAAVGDVPLHRNSSDGLARYNWYGMRNAGNYEPLPNPLPRYRGHVDPMDAMTADITARLRTGNVGPEVPLTPYEAAALRQQTRGGMEAVPGGRRDMRRLRPENEN